MTGRGGRRVGIKEWDDGEGWDEGWDKGVG